MTTPQELIAAYRAATGLPVTLSQTREMTLTMITQLETNVTPEDVTSVIEKLKYHMKRKPDIYTPECLEFRRVFSDPDKFEERVLSVRQEKARRAPKPKQVERGSVNGFNVLDDPVSRDVPNLDVRAALINVANNLKAG